MSEPLESEAGEDPGNLAIKRTRIGYAPALVGSRPSQVMSLPAEEPASTADMVPEIAAAAAATATGPHQTIVTPRFGGVLRKRDTKAMGAPERTRLRLVPGKLIPGTRYRLVRWLGEGGMGVVYEAEHIDIERHVALKILRFDLSQQPEMVQVFRDEARAASRMGHPNVVEIFDFGELPDGRLFICMEMLAGADLVPDVNALPDHGALIATLRQLCKGLAAAHANGIVHRDIKPENIILVERGGRSGVVKVVDFGISAMMAAGAPQSSRIAGTPHYMAPEQIEGKPFDGRLDMYAVGCVAYELMTGAAPFPGEVVEEVLLAQLDDEPTPPSKLRPERKIPAALEAVVLRCLAKQPARRYADMNDLEAALCEAQIAAGLRTAWDDLPLPPVDAERLARLRRGMPGPGGDARRRWWTPAIGLASLAAGIALTVALLPGEPGARARGEVDRLAEEALAAASLTHYIAPPADDPDAPTAYKKVLELEETPGDAASLADDRAAELRHRFASGLVTLGDKYWDVAGARPFAVEYYIWARSFDPANQRAIDRSGLTDASFLMFQDKAASGGWSLGELQALGLVRAFADDDPMRRREAVEDALADADQLSPRDRVALDEALRGAGVVPEPPRRAPPPEPPPEPESIAAAEPPVLGDILPAPALVPGGEPLHRKPRLARVKRDPAQARALAEAGAAALRAGRRADAESLFHQAIAYDNRNVKALMGLSDVYFDNGVKQKSVQFAELAVEAAPQSKACHLKLGDAYYNVLRYRDALEHYEKALALGEASAQSRIAKVSARIRG